MAIETFVNPFDWNLLIKEKIQIDVKWPVRIKSVSSAPKIERKLTQTKQYKKKTAAFQCMECPQKFTRKGYYCLHLESHKQDRMTESPLPANSVPQSPLPEFPGVQAPLPDTSVPELSLPETSLFDNFSDFGQVNAGFFICESILDEGSSSTEGPVSTTSDGNETPFECPDCQLKFQSSALVERHQHFHPRLSKYKCHLCDKVFCKAKGCRPSEGAPHWDKFISMWPLRSQFWSKTQIRDSSKNAHSNLAIHLSRWRQRLSFVHGGP